MKKTACVLCSAARGRRVCQLNDRSLICSVCCARIRNPDCEGCGYWAQAAAYAREKTGPRREPPFVAMIDPEVDAEVDRALEMAQGGRLRAAESIVAGLLDHHPDLHMVQFGIGVIRALQGRHADALAHFDRAIAIFPYFVEAWFNKGAAHQKMLEVGPTIRAYQKVVELGDPADDFVGEAMAVIRSLDKQIRADKGFSLDRYLQLMDMFDAAFAAMENQQWERALAGFQQVVAVDSGSTQSYGNMGLCYAFLGRRQEALAALDRALELDPAYEPAQTNRVRVLAMQEGERLAADFLSVDYYKDRQNAERGSQHTRSISSEVNCEPVDLGGSTGGESIMDLKILEDTPPWDWPEDASATFLDVLRDTQAAPSDRLLAAELAGGLVAINDELVDALLTLLGSDVEAESLRAQAAISLGPVLEQADTDGFEDPDDVPISERTFHAIQQTLHQLYLDARVPKEVRRRILEASVRAPQEWHADAIRAAFGSDDEDWKLTALFGMQFVRGFDAQILAALTSGNPDIRYEAVCAASAWGVEAAWPHVSALVRSKTTEKQLLLAAIEAVACIRPQEAAELLVDLTDSADEDIVEAAYEALAMAEGSLLDDDYDDEDDDEDA